METPTTVLIADDEPEIRALLGEYLVARGLAVREAGNGAEVEAALAENWIDLVLLDRTMPGGDSLRLVPALRARGVPVILLTALGADHDRIAGLEIGADDYLAKPFNLRELMARIQAVLRRARHGRGPVAARQASATGGERMAARRLSAVLYADAADFTRLMHADEPATLKALWTHLEHVIEPTVARHGGRIVKLTGDGFLAEFDSPDAALGAARAMQAAIAAGNAALPAAQRLVFRVGINWCPVLDDRGDIYGDGVNVAARLQRLAMPGEIWVSDDVRRAVSADLAAALEDMGERSLRHRPEPMRVFRLRDPVVATGTAGAR